MPREDLIAELTRDESCKLLVYDDDSGKPLKKGVVCVGHPTIGIGRALDVRGITKAEALYLLNNDIDAVRVDLMRELPWFFSLDDVRQRVLINMGFNMGTAGLMGFKDTLRHIANGEYGLAADAMKDSGWFRQVGARAERLVDMMRTGATAATTTA